MDLWSRVEPAQRVGARDLRDDLGRSGPSKTSLAGFGYVAAVWVLARRVRL